MPRRLLLLALPLLGGAPAFAQVPLLAQSCAAFGQAQYRALDPAVDQVTTLDATVPAVERFDGRVGAQAVAAALTLRGRISWKNRAPFETTFVCLLDAANRPLFFYAMPGLATRSAAPTPIPRGPTAGTVPTPTPTPLLAAPLLPLANARPPAATPSPSAPVPSATPPTAARSGPPPGAIRLRGLLREIAGRLSFTPCDGAPMALEDRTPGRELTRALADLTSGQEGRPMFVELYGARETGPGGGLGAVEVRRAAVETAGCRERFDQREWTATGNEPSWRLEVTGRDLLFGVLGGNALPRLAHGGLQRDGDAVVVAASEAPDVVVTIRERRCIDSQSGSLFAYAVEVTSDGRTYAGCAAHNPAMPVP